MAVLSLAAHHGTTWCCRRGWGVRVVVWWVGGGSGTSSAPYELRACANPTAWLTFRVMVMACMHLHSTASQALTWFVVCPMVGALLGSGCLACLHCVSCAHVPSGPPSYMVMRISSTTLHAHCCRGSHVLRFTTARRTPCGTPCVKWPPSLQSPFGD